MDSATRAATLTGRGAQVVETYTAELSHLDLLYASPVIGELLLEEAAQDPVEYGWLEGLANRYIEADTLGWLERVLADEGASGPSDTAVGHTGDTGAQAADTGVPDPRPDDPTGTTGWAGCTEGCGTGSSLAWIGLPLLGWLRREHWAGSTH